MRRTVVLAPYCGGPSADRGAKNEARRTVGRERQRLEDIAPNNPISDDTEIQLYLRLEEGDSGTHEVRIET